MARTKLHPAARGAWDLALRQHGVIARRQLVALGFTREAIAERIATGRLHPVQRGVYVVGTPALSALGGYMAAVLSCGRDAVLSHASAAALWELGDCQRGEVHVAVPRQVARRRPGLVVHRVTMPPGDRGICHGIPVTSPVRTLVDLATQVPRERLARLVNEADKRGLVDPERLRFALDRMPPRPGIRAVKEMLDRATFALTDSELERRFLPLAGRAGMPLPQTGAIVNGFKVDFFWPELGLVVETDGLRYHRTPAAQASDRLRDQAHAAAGLTALRFTHAQVRYEAGWVEEALARVTARLRARADNV